MDQKELEELLRQHSAGLTDEEALGMMRPELRERLRAYFTRGIRRGRTRRVVRRTVFALVPVAAAACVVWFMLPTEAALDLQVSVAGDAQALFTRGGEESPIHEEFWVGVDVGAPCWIHLVERTTAGELILMRPQASSDDYSMNITERTRLGPFSVIEPRAPAGPAPVTHLLAIATTQAIPGEVLASAIPDHVAAGEDKAEISAKLEELVRALRQGHGWEAQYQPIHAVPN